MPENSIPLPDFTRWPSFPFEGDMRVKPLAAPVEVEPPRSGEDAAECLACGTPDDAYIWVSDRWRVRAMDRPTGLPMVLILECRSHLDLGDLPNLLAAELGVMTVRLERAIRSLDGVARVHVNRWGDGSAHLHMWFLARPYGRLQLRGTFLALWDDILPVISDQQWRENLALVAAWLAEFGGQAIAEPAHIEWESPATFSTPSFGDSAPADEGGSGWSDAGGTGAEFGDGMGAGWAEEATTGVPAGTEWPAESEMAEPSELETVTTAESETAERTDGATQSPAENGTAKRADGATGSPAENGTTEQAEGPTGSPAENEAEGEGADSAEAGVGAPPQEWPSTATRDAQAGNEIAGHTEAGSGTATDGRPYAAPETQPGGVAAGLAGGDVAAARESAGEAPETQPAGEAAGPAGENVAAARQSADAAAETQLAGEAVGPAEEHATAATQDWAGAALDDPADGEHGEQTDEGGHPAGSPEAERPTGAQPHEQPGEETGHPTAAEATEGRPGTVTEGQAEATGAETDGRAEAEPQDGTDGRVEAEPQDDTDGDSPIKPETASRA